MSSVFLTDAQQRKTLAAARSLGRQGIEVLAGEDTRLALTFFSRYCRRAFVYPSPAAAPERWRDYMLALLAEHRPDVLLPMDDASMAVVVGNLAEFRRLTRVPVAEPAVLRALNDKGCLLTLARQRGVPAPRTVAPAGLEEIEVAMDAVGLPLVIKPRVSSGSRGVRFIHRREDLRPAYLEVHRRYRLPLIQEMIPPGEKYAVGVLYNYDSQLRAAFVQKELRQYPVGGGPCTLLESVDRPDLVRLTDDLLKGTGWCGAAQAEYLLDPCDGTPKLMEVNTRFWASLQGAIFAGVDFPHLIYRLALDGDVLPQPGYRAGIRSRWLLPGDTLHFLFNPRRREMQPGFFQFRAPETYDDIIDRDDPGAVLGFFLGAGRCALSLEMWRKVFFR